MRLFPFLSVSRSVYLSVEVGRWRAVLSLSLCLVSLPATMEMQDDTRNSTWRNSKRHVFLNLKPNLRPFRVSWAVGCSWTGANHCQPDKARVTRAWRSLADLYWRKRREQQPGCVWRAFWGIRRLGFVSVRSEKDSSFGYNVFFSFVWEGNEKENEVACNTLELYS